MKKLLLVLCLGFSFQVLAAESTCQDSWYKNEIPSIKYDKELCFNEFAVIYSNKDKAPIAVAEHLTTQEIIDSHSIPRKNTFHSETQLDKAYQSKASDYAKTGYDKGHMAPSGDMPNADDQYQSFSMANMTPQLPQLNRIQWRLIEEKVRDLTKTESDVWVVTGAIFSTKTIGDGVSVPSEIYKAVKSKNSEQIFVGDNTTGEVVQLTPEQFVGKYKIEIFN